MAGCFAPFSPYFCCPPLEEFPFLLERAAKWRASGDLSVRLVCANRSYPSLLRAQKRGGGTYGEAQNLRKC